MITEDYVSFETAKLLKEKEFNENCSRSYVKDKLAYSQGCNNSYYMVMYTDETYRPISAPTLQMVMKWLRKFHKLCAVVKPYITEEGIFYLFEIKEMNKDSVINKKTKTGFDTYEEACEAAIKYCLENLI